MIRKFVSAFVSTAMLFLLVTPVLANTLPTTSIQLYQTAGETYCGIESDDYIAVLVETDDDTILVALVSKEDSSQITQIYVPLSEVTTSGIDMWSEAFEYALNEAFLSEGETFVVQTTYASPRASATYVEEAISQI